jgi:methyltransferase (TIGR00027 family)
VNKRDRTAQAIALFRAIESARPAPERMFHDPLAARLLSGPFRVAAHMLRLPHGNRLLERAFDHRIPGVRGSAVVRTHLIDEAVLDAFASGCRQLVLLGAGYDSRPYRLDMPEGTVVYEVDRAAVQDVKQAQIQKQLRVVPQNVRFVPIDFELDDLVPTLRQAGFDPSVAAVFVWEGVTYYLTDTAVDATLNSIAATTTPGSRLVLTYMDHGVLQGTGAFDGDAQLLTAVKRVGERFTFGLDPDDTPKFLAHRGFDLISDVTTEEVAAHLDPRIRASKWEHVAIAATHDPAWPPLRG